MSTQEEHRRLAERALKRADESMAEYVFMARNHVDDLTLGHQQIAHLRQSAMVHAILSLDNSVHWNG